MCRRPITRALSRALPAAMAVAALVLGGIAVLLPAAVVHAQDVSQPTLNQITHESGNPIEDQGSNYEYRSNITSVTPDVRGLNLEVLEFADRLILTNHTGKTVTVYGYEGEPYARVLADGTVEVNIDAPAYYLNQSFYAQVSVPASASSSAPPRWVVADRTGQFEWHDHRIHWMSPIPPARVRDKSRRTLIFDWQVPIQVGAQKGEVNGQLFWTPESSHAPTVVIVLGVAIVLLGLLFVLYVRRRRARAGSTGGSAGSGRGEGGTGGGGVGGGGANAAGGSRAPAQDAW